MLNTVPAAAVRETGIARLIREHHELDRQTSAIGHDAAAVVQDRKFDELVEQATNLRIVLVRSRPVDFEDMKRKAIFAYGLCEDDVDSDIAEDLAKGVATQETLTKAFLRDFIVAYGSNFEQAAPLAQVIPGADAMKLEAEFQRQIDEGAADLAARRPPMTLRSIFNRLNSATRFVECAWLASGNVKDETDCPSIKAVLDESLCQLHDLAEDVKPLLGDEEEEEEEA